MTDVISNLCLTVFNSKYNFIWSKERRFPKDELKVASFDVTVPNRTNHTCRRMTDKNCLVLTFKFRRQITTALISIYFPSTLLVLISFLSFWIEVTAVPGRVTLVVTSLLALVTQLCSTRERMAAVSYVTALDIWFFACLSLVCLSLFEFVLSYTRAIRVSVHFFIIFISFIH